MIIEKREDGGTYVVIETDHGSPVEVLLPTDNLLDRTGQGLQSLIVIQALQAEAFCSLVDRISNLVIAVQELAAERREPKPASPKRAGS